MTDGRDDFREHLSFSQRYGYEPLPGPMQLEQLSDDLRRDIANCVRSFFLGWKEVTPWSSEKKRFAKSVWGEFTKQLESQIVFDSGPEQNFEEAVMKGKFNHVLDLLQIMIKELPPPNPFTAILCDEWDFADDRYILDPDPFTADIKTLFEKNASAYCLDTSQKPYQFIQRASKEQGEATQRATETIADEGMTGAATHLRQAAEHINAGQYADAVRDSIHAVESVARTIDPKSNKTLGPALNSLEKAGVLKHKTLKKAFGQLYGYTNEEQGIRHALVDQGTAAVGLDEAIFMYGACACFAAYLTTKHQQTKEGEAEGA